MVVRDGAADEAVVGHLLEEELCLGGEAALDEGVEQGGAG